MRALQQQMRRLRQKMERERLFLAELPALSVSILDHLRDHGRITMGEALTLTGVSRNTLKEHFRNLLERGLISLHGRGRGAWYGLS